MTVSEMVYVLDKEKECIQRRTIGECDKNCGYNCSAYIEPASLLDAQERIVNYIFYMDKHSTRKSY